MMLTVTPFPKKGQSPSCYARDLAKANTYCSTQHFKSKFFDRPDFEMEELTKYQYGVLIGRSPDHLKELKLTRLMEEGEQLHEYGTLKIPSYHLRQGEWYCPYCLRDQRYMEAKWKIGWLPLCTKHECVLEEADISLKNALFHDCDLSISSKNTGNALFDYDLVDAQRQLETQLEKESRLLNRNQAGVVTLIESFLAKSLVLEKASALWSRKRRYGMRYYPFKTAESIRFLECLAVQKAA